MKINFESGLSLIEILVSALISVFLILGVIQVFINTQQLYRLQENSSRIQENGSLALDLIGRDLRVTSYWGCLKRSTGDLIGTDVSITLKAAFVQIPTGTCGSIVDKNLVYYADPTSTIIYTLYNGVLRKATNGQNNDLIEGVETVLFLYGEDVDSDNNVNDYVPANQVLNWESVLSVRVMLRLKSFDDNITSKSLPYVFNGVTFQPTDHHLRRVFTETFALRNRLP